MTPEPITIDGRTGTVVYLDAEWHPVTPADATMAKVLYDDGGSAFFTVQSSAMKKDTFDEAKHPRDDEGQFVTVAPASHEDYIADLSMEDRELLWKYTRANSDVARLDRTEAQGWSKEAVARYKQQADTIDRIIEQAPKLDHPAVVWRGEKYALDVKPGEIFTLADYPVSTSFDRGIAARFTQNDYDDSRGPLLRIVAKHGLAVEGKSKHAYERELVLPRNKKYRVDKIVPTKRGSEIWLTEVDDAQKGESARVLLVQSVAKAPGIGGLTQKFDAAAHPRGEDGRFIEATQPRIFNRPDEVRPYDSMGGEKRWGWLDPKTGETTGRLLTGQPIPPEDMRATLYHVTTNAPAVESSGVLLGQLGDSGLGGGQAPGVSFTTSHEDATVIQRELVRAVQVAQGTARKETIEQWAREDEKSAGLPEGALQGAVDFAMYNWNDQSLTKTFVWDKNLPDDKRGWVGPPPSPEEHERLYRSMVSDAQKAYLQLREREAEKAAGHPVTSLKNPILFGRQEQLAKLNPEHVQILEVPSAQIPEGALVTTGSDDFLHEVRAYSDVPLWKKLLVKFDESKHPRTPGGTEHGGEFARTQQGARGALMDVMNGPVGVDDHPVAIRAAHETAAVLREMKAKGYPMPDEVEVRVKGTIISGEADRQTLIVRVPDNLPPEMSLDEAFEVVYGEKNKIAVVEDGVLLGEIQKFEGDKFRDLVIHEMGHLLRQPTIFSSDPTLRSTPEELAQNAASREQFAKEMKAIRQYEHAARTSVSNYAATNPDEFVAEVFTALYNGRTLPSETMQIYRDLRGAKVL